MITVSTEYISSYRYIYIIILFTWTKHHACQCICNSQPHIRCTSTFINETTWESCFEHLTWNNVSYLQHSQFWHDGNCSEFSKLFCLRTTANVRLLASCDWLNYRAFAVVREHKCLLNALLGTGVEWFHQTLYGNTAHCYIFCKW